MKNNDETNKWAEVNIETFLETEEAINNILLELGIYGVFVREGSEEEEEADVFKEPLLVKCYLPYDRFMEKKVETLRENIMTLNDYGFKIREKDFSVKTLDDNNWIESWKNIFKPIEIGKVIIKPTWEELDWPLDGDEILIELNPEMAFGTGLHPTTKACLRFLQSYLVPGEEILDLGVGSGILSIAAAKLGAKKVYAYDISPEAYRATQKNAELNGVKDFIEVQQVDVLRSMCPRVSLGVANMNSSVLLDLLEKVDSFLIKEGVLIVSGIIFSKGEEIKDKAEKNGLIVVEEYLDEEWLSLVLKKI